MDDGVGSSSSDVWGVFCGVGGGRGHRAHDLGGTSVFQGSNCYSREPMYSEPIHQGIGLSSVRELRGMAANSPRRMTHRSWRGDAFWQTQPQRARLLLFPRARRAPAALPPPDATSARSAPPVVAPTPALAAVLPADVPSVPRPLRPVADHPWRRQPLGRARSA